jgi:diguanylate cyclase (GGDEF)-like protein/PAS domain S-box-containing protein
MKKIKLPDISEKSIAVILEIISDGVWDWNANTGDVYRSPGWYIMLGYDVDSLEGSVFSWENVIHPDDYPRVMQYFESYITHQIDHYKIRYRCITRAGDYIYIEDRGRIVEWNPDGSVARMIGAHRNIDSEIKLNKQHALENKTLQELVDIQTKELLEVNSQLSKLNAESQKLATTDFLTSLANRYWFEQKLRNEIDRVKRFYQPLSLVAFDLDNFKPVNDTYGHLAGDLVLKSVAKILHENVREIDTASRWGGDEFMLLLPNTTVDQSVKLAEKIQQFINEEMNKQKLSVTASFGVAELKKSETPMRFTIRADNAMYESKKLGGNKITISR